MTNRRQILFRLPAVLAGVAGLSRLAAQGKGDEKRTVKGLVMSQAEKPLSGAVVQIKNTKTLEVKSFIADSTGAYHFHGLDPNVDYQLVAQFQGATSRKRTVSTFDSRDEVVYNLTVEVEK